MIKKITFDQLRPGLMIIYRNGTNVSALEFVVGIHAWSISYIHVDHNNASFETLNYEASLAGNDVIFYAHELIEP